MTLLDHLAAYGPFTAIVIGDFMLDEQVHGAAERLSPDAPVPVLHQSRIDRTPGGASNVARCLRDLKANVRCFGVVGDDAEGRILREQLAQAGCDVEGLIVDTATARPTTVKRSLIGLAQHRHPQKMFRVDIESREPIADSIVGALCAAIERSAGDADVILIEDYDKGVCTAELCARVIAHGRSRGVPVLVDPAAIDDYARYRGATAITPNRSEAELATQLDQPIEATTDHNATMASTLQRDLDLDAVVLTLDKQGAMLALRDDPIDTAPRMIPTVARSVYDVTGAGDMVLAALAGAVANDFGWTNAVRFANAAAGLEVEVFGAQPIPFARICRSIEALARPMARKVRTREELVAELNAHRGNGACIILTNGCFDVIHAGHLHYLRDAKRAATGDRASVLVVGVNADEQVRALKGEGRPVYPIQDRLDLLSELECIDYLIEFEEPTAHELLRAVQPDLYVKGGDYEPHEIAEYDLAQELGVELRILGHRPGLSSTNVIEHLAQHEQPTSTSP